MLFSIARTCLSVSFSLDLISSNNADPISFFISALVLKDTFLRVGGNEAINTIATSIIILMAGPKTSKSPWRSMNVPVIVPYLVTVNPLDELPSSPDHELDINGDRGIVDCAEHFRRVLLS